MEEKAILKKSISKSVKKEKYICEICEYGTMIRRDLNRHMQTKKHIENAKEDTAKNRRKFYCTNCPSFYLTQAGINRHKKICVDSKIDKRNLELETERYIMEIKFLELENKHLKLRLKEHNIEF